VADPEVLHRGELRHQRGRCGEWASPTGGRVRGNAEKVKLVAILYIDLLTAAMW